MCSKSSSNRPPDGAEWLVVGRVAKPHGIHGELLVDIITDLPERLDDGVRFGVGDENGALEFFETHRVRYHKGRWLLSIKGIRDRAAVEQFRGRYLFLPELGLDQLPDGYYYEHHLVGLECRGGDGSVYGTVVGIDPGVEQTRLVVRKGRREYLVPYVPEIVREVDLAGGFVLLEPPSGLLDDDAVTA